MRLATVILAAFLLSSCSNIGLGYKFADNYIIWQANKAFDLTAKQEDQLERKVQRLKQWHQSNELPRYVADLRELRQRINNQQTDGISQWFNQQVINSQIRLYDFALQDSIDLLMQLTPSQLQHFQEYVADKAKDRAKDWSRKDSLERMFDQYETWLGELTGEQKTLIRQYQTDVPYNYPLLRREHSLAINDIFIAAINAQDQTTLEKWFNGQIPSPIAEFQAIRDQQQQNAFALVDALIPTISQTQRRYLINELDDLIDDLADLY